MSIYQYINISGEEATKEAAGAGCGISAGPGEGRQPPEGGREDARARAGTTVLFVLGSACLFLLFVSLLSLSRTVKWNGSSGDGFISCLFFLPSIQRQTHGFENSLNPRRADTHRSATRVDVDAGCWMLDVDVDVVVYFLTYPYCWRPKSLPCSFVSTHTGIV